MESAGNNATVREYPLTRREQLPTHPDDLSGLRHRLDTSVRRVRRSQRLLWSFTYAADLPRAR